MSRKMFLHTSSCTTVVQTSRFSSYLHDMPLYSTMYTLYEFTISHRVVITVYKGIPPLSFTSYFIACIIIVEYSRYITLGERIPGNLRFGVDSVLVYIG